MNEVSWDPKQDYECSRCKIIGCDCEQTFIPDMVMRGWGLTTDSWFAYVSLLHNPSIKAIKELKGIGKTKFQKIVKQLTEIHPRWNKSLIKIDGDKAIITNIYQENEVYCNSDEHRKTCGNQ